MNRFINDLVLRDRKSREGGENYPMLKYVRDDGILNTESILLNPGDLIGTFNDTLMYGNHRLMYLLLLFLDYKALDPRNDKIIDRTFYIIDGVEHLDQGYMSSKSYRKELGYYPMLRTYMAKIKTENIELYNKIISKCISPSEENRHICNIINEFIS